jgi:hypothetical protein
MAMRPKQKFQRQLISIHRKGPEGEYTIEVEQEGSDPLEILLLLEKIAERTQHTLTQLVKAYYP